MELLDGLEYVRQLAQQKREYEQVEMRLQNCLEPLIPLIEVQDVSPISIDTQKKWGLLILLEFVLGYLANKAINFLLSYFVNGCMTFQQSIDAGYIGYQNITVFWLVGAVIALPLAWILTGIILKVIKVKNSQQHTKWQQEIEIATQNNREIQAQNARITEHNAQVQSKLREVNELQAQIEQALTQNVPWYPKAYFTLEIVDFVIYEIQNGYANTVQQALVHYESEQHFE